MRFARQLSPLVVLAALTVTGCATQSKTAAAPPTPSATPLQQTPASPVSRPASPATTNPNAGGAVSANGWSTGPRIGGPTSPQATAAVLREIRTGHTASYDRVVFEFTGAVPGYRVEYRSTITDDPTDRPVHLAGRAYLLVVMQGATLDNAFQGGHDRYAGPTRVSPNYSQLRDVSFSGDFEAVLSFGVGLDHRAGFRVLTLTQPSRVVVDVATT